MNLSSPLPMPQYGSTGRVCKNCCMDESDPKIHFDEDGVCNYCNFTMPLLSNLKSSYPGNNSANLLMSEEIKSRRGSSEYDCIIGLSGGLDSSFTAHMAVKEMNLKPLLVHVDAGWNNAQAVSNIRAIADGLGLDLHTIIFPWRTLKDIHLAFFQSGLPFLDVPQDSVFFSELYRYAVKYNVKSVITGANLMTESVREPFEWGAYPGTDPSFIHSVFDAAFPDAPLAFKPVSSIKSRLYFRYLKGMKIFKPINNITYDVKAIETMLLKEYGWKPFKHKHHESRFTKFIEAYWLPYKHNVDRRKAHFSSMILSGNLSRAEAVRRLREPAYDVNDINYDFHFVADKLELEPSSLFEILNQPVGDFKEYSSSYKMYGKLARLQSMFTAEKRLYR